MSMRTNVIASSGDVQDALTEQGEASAAIHHALDQLDAMNLTFHDAIAIAVG